MFETAAGISSALEKIYHSPDKSLEEIKELLWLENGSDVRRLFFYARAVRERFCGGGVLLRGLIEFSNRCASSCFYCGLNKNNRTLTRYMMSAREILECAQNIKASGIKTVVLQSGEDDDLDPGWLAGIIIKIKKCSGLAVTLSVGEKSRDEYRMWRQAGADRYLLKIETTDPVIYAAAHSGRRLESRLRCIDDLIELGYQTGSGILIGLKGQTIDSIARDILFLKERDFDMVGIGPFIPHPDTAHAAAASGSAELTLKAMAAARIVTRNAHMPATTALASAGKDHRIEGLMAGANVLMPNFTPAEYKKLYQIYPGKSCINESAEECLPCLERKARSAGSYINRATGHSLKSRHQYNYGGQEWIKRL